MTTVLEILACCLLTAGWTLLAMALSGWLMVYLFDDPGDFEDHEIVRRALKLGVPLTIAGHALGAALW